MRDIYQWMKGLSKERQRRVDKEGSPVERWAVPVTVALATSQINIGDNFPALRKYMPMDHVVVTNNDVVDLTLIVNNDEFYPIPKGVIQPVRREGIRQLGIRNDDAVTSTTLNKVIVSIEKTAMTADEAARRNL